MLFFLLYHNPKALSVSKCIYMFSNMAATWQAQQWFEVMIQRERLVYRISEMYKLCSLKRSCPSRWFVSKTENKQVSI